jgi:hypothetical protein
LAEVRQQEVGVQISVWIDFEDYHKFIAGRMVQMHFKDYRGKSINVICEGDKVDMQPGNEVNYATYTIRRTDVPKES